MFFFTSLLYTEKEMLSLHCSIDETQAEDLFPECSFFLRLVQT